MSRGYKILATLVRGQTYILRGKKMEFGVAKEVTEDEREHLIKHAVDTLSTSDGEIFKKQKFKFEEVKPVVVKAKKVAKKVAVQEEEPNEDTSEEDTEEDASDEEDDALDDDDIIVEEDEKPAPKARVRK